MHADLQDFVDKEILSCASSAVLKGQDLLDIFTTGHADIEGDIALRTDHIMRLHSTTKLFVTTAIMMFVEEGKVSLDDPIDKWISQLGNRKVLIAGATDRAQVEDAGGPITIRQLLSHTSGLAYGLFDPGTLTFEAYQAAGVNNLEAPLTAMMDTLKDIPLAYQPGTSWEYSVATDVLGHLVELISDMTLGDFFETRIFKPLGMKDTGFYLKPGTEDRLAKIYLGADMMDPLKPGLSESPGLFAADYSKPPVRHSGGGGMVGTLDDIILWMRSFLPGGHALLKPETIKAMQQSQLPGGKTFGLFGMEVPSTGFGLGGAVKFAANPGESEAVIGEYHWGGVGGTHWFINPALGVAGLAFTQREMAFWHPFYAEFKQNFYEVMAP
jgi:CubicO group peptidase (beta-lactamase class C family)